MLSTLIRLQFLNEMQWQQIYVLHESDMFGESFRDTFERMRGKYFDMHGDGICTENYLHVRTGDYACTLDRLQVVFPS